jgi:hydrogenase maturation protease
VTARVLVAGIGNIFLGDDGFGVEVAQRLRQRPVRPAVRVEDFGIRGVHLAYELLDGYDTLVLVDAMATGEPAGTVVVMEPDRSVHALDESVGPALEAHSMDPVVVLDLVARLGGSLDRVVVVGCEPESLDDGIGLSVPVAGAVDRAIGAIESLLEDLCATDDRTDPKETRS